MAICSLNVVIYVTDKERPLLALVLAALLVALAAGFGYGDAIWEYPIARGQHIQFFIISIITAGVFTVLYLAAYFTGKRWPRRNKRSMPPNRFATAPRRPGEAPTAHLRQTVETLETSTIRPTGWRVSSGVKNGSQHVFDYHHVITNRERTVHCRAVGAPT